MTLLENPVLAQVRSIQVTSFTGGQLLHLLENPEKLKKYAPLVSKIKLRSIEVVDATVHQLQRMRIHVELERSYSNLRTHYESIFDSLRPEDTKKALNAYDQLNEELQSNEALLTPQQVEDLQEPSLLAQEQLDLRYNLLAFLMLPISSISVDATEMAETTSLKMAGAVAHYHGLHDTFDLPPVTRIKSLPLSVFANLAFVGSDALMTIEHLGIVCDGNLPAEAELQRLLPVMDNLTSLSLENCRQLTTLPRMENLKSLSLENCHQLTTLPEGMNQLTSLRIKSCRKLQVPAYLIKAFLVGNEFVLRKQA